MKLAINIKKILWRDYERKGKKNNTFTFLIKKLMGEDGDET